MMEQERVAERIKASFPFVNIVFGTHVIHRLPGDDVHRRDRLEARFFARA